jgi:integrase
VTKAQQERVRRAAAVIAVVGRCPVDDGISDNRLRGLRRWRGDESRDVPADGADTRSLAHYLGHRNLQSTARYTALAPDRFAKFWQD